VSAFDATSYPRLKHRGKAKTVRQKYQHPKVQDLGKKWKLVYWDYSSGEARKRSKVWAKSGVPSLRKVQHLADEFMLEVNSKNNDPRLASPDDYTVAGLYKKCLQLTWPHLKKPSIENYEYYFDDFLIPGLGNTQLDELNTVELQAFFNSFIARLSPKTIKNMHAALRAALSQAIAWGMIDKNAAVGVKLPRMRQVKPPIVLAFVDIRRMIEALPEPAKSIVVLIVFASMRIGEVLALRWNDILQDRIIVDERIWEGDLDDPKTINGKRDLPFDRQGVLKETLTRAWEATKFRKPENFVFSTRNGTPLQRRNVLRHLKTAAKKLGLPRQIDFRSFRTMHSSLMRHTGARAEVVRDNMGHSEIPTTLEIYSRTWWEERQAAVSATVDLLMSAEPDQKSGGKANPRAMLFCVPSAQVQLEPQLEPCRETGAMLSVDVVERIGRGERI
jgi:integrase